MSGIVKFGQQIPVFEARIKDGTAPPCDLDAEVSVLGAVLFDEDASNRVLKSVCSLLTVDHFYSEANRRIFEAALLVHESGKHVDFTTVANQLKSQDRLNQVGGMAYLKEIMLDAPTALNPRQHAECVFDMWRRRQMIVACQKTEAQLYVGDVGASDLQGYLDKQAREMLTIASRNPRVSGESLFDVLTRVLRSGAMVVKRANANGGDAPIGATTSLAALDELTGGLLPGKKFTIVARPGRGKSVLGLQIARVNAQNGVGSAFFATEQTSDELAVRLLASTARIDSKRVMQFMHRPTLSPEEWQRITVAGQANAKLPMLIESDYRMTVDDIVTKATALHHTFMARFGAPLGIVVVDYLQRLAKPKHMGADVNKAHANHYATERLKSMAQELGVVVIELAQQSMKEDKNGKHRKPEEGMVDWCRDAERESDGVLYIWERDKEDFVGVLTKVREGGMAGEFPIQFDKPHSTMTA